MTSPRGGHFRPAAYDDIDWRRVRRITVVPFLEGIADVVLVAKGRRLVLPAGRVDRGEDVLLDTALRVPLAGAGFRRQGTHVLAATTDRRHAAFWVDGARYWGDRPHKRDAAWWTGPAGRAAHLLREQGNDAIAGLVELADDARRNLTDEQYFTDCQRLLDSAYLAAATPEGGSGFGGDADEWRLARSMLCDAVERDGTFLDVGCANGLLMESMVEWCAEKGVAVEPYGVDISADLVALARRRLPHWAERIWVGNALTWVPPEGRRFDVVHTLLDCVPPARHRDLVAGLLDVAVAPGGRLLVSQYGGVDRDHWPAKVLERLGYEVAGVTRRPDRDRPDAAPSAWVAKG